MTRGAVLSNERGFALIYTAVFLTGLLLFTGLAVDSGRAYVVKAQLTKAVDGAALGAARNLNSGNPRTEAAQIFRANFPPDYMGIISVTDPSEEDFFSLTTEQATGVNVVTVRASATLPTTFMRLGNFQQLTVSSTGEATRRMVDLSLVLDVSSSIASSWGAVRDAARTFVNAFDAASDRLALVLYSNGANVPRAMPSSRGFDKPGMISAIPNNLPGGSTAMVEGLYRGWDELRSVSNGQQSSLRVIVLFTDGASNSVPGLWDATGTSKGLRTYDFPEHPPDPDNQTHDNPAIVGLFYTQGGGASPLVSRTLPWDSRDTITTIPFMPTASFHQHHRSGGIPTSFAFQSNTLRVNGTAQSTRRGLREFDTTADRYPAQIYNINNAARNLVEIIANEARDDDAGDYPIRIYTIGMGELVRYELGTQRETSESILMRMANDPRSPDFDDDQLEGRYYYARTAADVGPAFQALQAQIIRLTK
ncbi:MAG: VWA domain-containing protein [Vicinamibacterales bacterium]